MEAGYASHRRGSIEDHTTDISTPVCKVVLKGSKTMKQNAEANVYALVRVHHEQETSLLIKRKQGD